MLELEIQGKLKGILAVGDGIEQLMMTDAAICTGLISSGGEWKRDTDESEDGRNR